MLRYEAEDGSGSAVKATSATIDGQRSLNGRSLANNTPVDLLSQLSLGTHTFTVEATDHVGNRTTQSVTFAIIATSQSIIHDIALFVDRGDIDAKRGTSLTVKLAAAAKSSAAGRCDTAANEYRAFIHEVEAQTDKGISRTASRVLIDDAQYLIANCR